MASAWTETRTKTDPKTGKATKSYLARWREPGEVSPKSKSFRRKSDALAFANARKVQLQKGTYVTEEKRTVTVADYLRLLINAHAGLRPGTRVNNLWRLESHIASDPLGGMSLGDVNADHVRAWAVRLEAKGLASGTRAVIHTLLSWGFKTALAEGRVPRNPCATVPRPTVRSRGLVPYTHDEVEALAGAVYPRYRAAVYLAAYCGLRAGEVGGVKLSRIDWQEGTILVAEQATANRAERAMAAPKTSASYAKVRVPQSVLGELRAHLEHYPLAEDGRLFVRPGDGGLVTHQELGQAIRVAGKKLGWSTVPRFHALRHTGASILISRGAHPKDIQEWCRHASFGVTMNTYGHLFPARASELADLLDESRTDAANVRRIG